MIFWSGILFFVPLYFTCWSGVLLPLTLICIRIRYPDATDETRIAFLAPSFPFSACKKPGLAYIY
jgi:hypothetical protein